MKFYRENLPDSSKIKNQFGYYYDKKSKSLELYSESKKSKSSELYSESKKSKNSNPIICKWSRIYITPSCKRCHTMLRLKDLTFKKLTSDRESHKIYYIGLLNENQSCECGSKEIEYRF